jgi:hypothetical protein
VVIGVETMDRETPDTPSMARQHGLQSSGPQSPDQLGQQPSGKTDGDYDPTELLEPEGPVMDTQ